VLDLAKIESGKMEFQPEAINLMAIVAEVRDILRLIAAAKRVTIVTEIDRSIGRLLIDPGKLKQVFYNFLSNALKFTPDGGRVTIRANRDGEKEFIVEIEDTGIGISDDDMQRLLVEFQQLDASIAKKYQGTGLGLALTERIVEAQSGRSRSTQHARRRQRVLGASASRASRRPDIAPSPVGGHLRDGPRAPGARDQSGRTG
jgi:signal transduction histidine kinase